MSFNARSNNNSQRSNNNSQRSNNNSQRPNNARSFNERRPHCVHCQQTGEPESVYTSHYVKSLPDRTGKRVTTCPKLLATECTYCYGLGHTRGHCAILKERRLAYERDERKQQVEQQKQEQLIAKSKQVTFGRFDALRMEDNDDESKEIAQPTIKEDFPALGEPSQRVPSTRGYAAAAATPKVEPIIVKKSNDYTSNFQVLERRSSTKKVTEEPSYYGSNFARSLNTDAQMTTTWAAKIEVEDDDYGYEANKDYDDENW